MERQEIEDRLAGLRADRGAAQIDGKQIANINAAIAEGEAQLAALDDAELVRVSRQREQDAKDAEANLRAKVKRIADLERRRLQAWADLETATRALLDAIGRVKSSTESERVLLNDITAAVPMQLGSFETKHRVRGRVSEFLHAASVGFELPGVRAIYGQAPLQDWREEERKALASHLEHLMEE